MQLEIQRFESLRLTLFLITLILFSSVVYAQEQASPIDQTIDAINDALANIGSPPNSQADDSDSD